MDPSFWMVEKHFTRVTVVRHARAGLPLRYVQQVPSTNLPRRVHQTMSATGRNSSLLEKSGSSAARPPLIRLRMHRPFENSALLVIDVQQAFDNPVWGQRNNLGAERCVAELLHAWRTTKRPIIHVHHLNPRQGSLFNPGSVGARVKPEAEPRGDEPLLAKDVNSAFIGTDLEARLRAAEIGTIVAVGMTTDHCVSTTVRMAANLGFSVMLVDDATATFERTSPTGRRFSAEEMHETAITSLNGEFATIASTAAILRTVSH